MRPWDLLAQLDADEEVKRDGRSAVLRRAAEAYLRQRRERAVAEAYRRAYGRGDALGNEFAGWEEEGIVARTVNRGEIWMYRLKSPDKRRPVVVISRQTSFRCSTR